jgi:glucokinase
MMIFDGTYYDGVGYGAGFIGHTYVPDWTAINAGAHQKVENLCSGRAIEKRLRSPGYVPQGSLLTAMCAGDLSKLTCRMLGRAAVQGDAFALAEIDRIAWSYSVGLSNVITLLSPDRVSIGGGVANLGDVLLEPVRRHTDSLVFVASRGRYDIVQCTFMDNSVVIGAAVYAADHAS